MSSEESIEPASTFELKERHILVRISFAALGILFVAIAAVGVFLPGIPTVLPLILASLFLTKSSPKLEQRLVRNKFFAAYLHYLDGNKELSPKAKITATAMMWASILVSCTVLYWAGRTPNWLIGLLIVAGLAGTIFIGRYGKRSDQRAAA